jgi:hypothetical protein
LASLNTLVAEAVAHGADILIQAKGATGAYVTLAEVKGLTLNVDDNVVTVPQMGTRRNSARPGRLLVTGDIKDYWVNQAVFTEWLGSTSAVVAGSASVIYASARPFARYNIRVALVSGGQMAGTIDAYNIEIVNVVFEKDVAIWDMDKLTEETISFQAEDVIYNSA